MGVWVSEWAEMTSAVHNVAAANVKQREPGDNALQSDHSEPRSRNRLAS